MFCGESYFKCFIFHIAVIDAVPRNDNEATWTMKELHNVYHTSGPYKFMLNNNNINDDSIILINWSVHI